MITRTAIATSRCHRYPPPVRISGRHVHVECDPNRRVAAVTLGHAVEESGGGHAARTPFVRRGPGRRHDRRCGCRTDDGGRRFVVVQDDRVASTFVRSRRRSGVDQQRQVARPDGVQGRAGARQSVVRQPARRPHGR